MSRDIAAQSSGEIVEFAQRLWAEYVVIAPRIKRRKLGQYCTPSRVAVLMAERACASLGSVSVRALDPAAGTGVLAAAVIEELVRAKVEVIEFDLFEVDPVLAVLLDRFVEFAGDFCSKHGVRLGARVHREDFLVWRSSSEGLRSPPFDLVISNPPYFKLRRSDERVEPWLALIDAQPNIYGLFMLATLSLLSRHGAWCFLTPQSWMMGSYFSLLRRHLTSALRIHGFHFIEDRTGVFGGRGHVRQDVVITWGAPEALSDYSIEVCSSGADGVGGARRVVPLSEVLLDHGGRLARVDRVTPAIPRLLNYRLSDLGVVVRTGAVVPFRCQWALKDCVDSERDVPLLWLKHVRHQHIVWPAGAKREVMSLDARTERYVVADRGAVLVRRFGPSDSHKRVVASPVIPDSFGSPFAVENHVNVLMRLNGTLDSEECIGLAAFLSSAWVDEYLKRTAGTTQINAADLRELPVPSEEGLRMIAASMKSSRVRSIDDVLVRFFD